MEKIAFEIWNSLQNFPETLTSESLEEISKSIPRDLCKQRQNSSSPLSLILLLVLKCFERMDAKEEMKAAEDLLTWIYVYCPQFRSKIRSMIGLRLMSSINSPESLRSFDINPLLKVPPPSPPSNAFAPHPESAPLKDHRRNVH
jgi:hypothetical protein